MGVMSDFLTGLASGLLGAVAGGLFTAWAARAQVKAALSAAQLQIKSTQEAQRAAAFNGRRLLASDDMVKSLTQILRELQEMSDAHEEEHHSTRMQPCGEPAPSAQCLRKINDWRRELDRITYEHSDFLEDMGAGDLEHPGPFGYVVSGKDWSQIRRRFPRVPPDACIREEWSDAFFSSLHGLITSICAERYRYI